MTKDRSETSNQFKMVGCPRCLYGLRVEHKEGHGFGFRMPECPRCIDEDSILMIEDPQELVEVDVITYDDFIAMAHGFGTPVERVEPEIIKYLLESRKILEVTVGGKRGRADIHTIKLDDGSTIHLNGAIAFKVTRE